MGGGYYEFRPGEQYEATALTCEVIEMAGVKKTTRVVKVKFATPFRVDHLPGAQHQLEPSHCGEAAIWFTEAEFALLAEFGVHKHGDEFQVMAQPPSLWIDFEEPRIGGIAQALAGWYTPTAGESASPAVATTQRRSGFRFEAGLSVTYGGKVFELSSLTRSILKILHQHYPGVVSMHDFRKGIAVWKSGVDQGTISSAMYDLRTRLNEKLGKGKWVTTLRGEGWKLTPTNSDAGSM